VGHFVGTKGGKETIREQEGKKDKERKGSSEIMTIERSGESKRPGLPVPVLKQRERKRVPSGGRRPGSCAKKKMVEGNE